LVIHAGRDQHFAHVRENAWSLFGKQYELGARQLALGTAHCETVTLARTLSVSRNTPCRTALLRADSELHFRRSAITNVVERAHHDHPPVQESLDRIEPGSPQWWGPTPGNSLLTAGCRGARAMKTKETAVRSDARSAPIPANGPVRLALYGHFLSFQVVSVGQLVCCLQTRVSQNGTTLITRSRPMC
jgi:hypothetical protein